MNQKMLSSLCDQVYRRFPEVAGSRPKVQKQPDERLLLIFQGSAKTADGHILTRTVRVVAGQDGKIIKVSTSR